MKKNKKPVIAYLFTHWDAEWYRTADSFNVRLVEIFDKVLFELINNKAPSFYFDGQVYALLNYLKFRPEKKNLIKKLIKEKKLFIGPFFASADSFLVSGASLIRNLETGLKISNSFGCKNFLGYLSDTFGHSKSIFKILNIFNIENAVIWRGVPDIKADFTVNKIKTTRLVQGYYHDILHTSLPFDKKAEILENTLDKINEKSDDVLLLPIGADHTGILENAQSVINEINKNLKNYEIKLSNIFEYFEKARYTLKIPDCEFLDNSITYILPGVYSARSDEKVQNSILQYNLFYKAEVLNYFFKGKYNSELDYAALKLIKNHAHDSIYGCSIDDVHKTVRCRQTEVKETINAVIKSIIRDFKTKYLIKENDKLAVFNLSNYPQGETIKIITDKKIKNAQKISRIKTASDDIFYNINRNPVTEDFHDFYEYLVEIDEIKPFSFKNFEIKKPVVKHIIDNDFIENKNFKLFILDNKIYVIDKIKGEIYPDFIQIHSTEDEGDSYNFVPMGRPYVLKLKKTKVKIRGKIKSALQLTYEENFKLNLSLGNNSKLFEIEAEFNNKKKNRKLQIVFNTLSPVIKTTAEDAAGTVERFHDPSYLLFDHIPVKDKSELKTNSYPMQRFVSANNLAIITKGLNEYEIYENSIKIALLRSTGIISNPENKARGVPAGPPIECPDMQGLGLHKFNIAFGFNMEPDELFASADNFYNPFVSISGEFKIKNKTFIKTEDDSYFMGISEFKGGKKPLFIKK